MSDSGVMSISPDSFMQLFVTQMQYQDPTEPMDTSAMMAQLAQLTTVQGIQNLDSTFASVLQSEQLGLAQSLIGSQVNVTDGSEVYTGVVESAAVNDGIAGVVIQDLFVPVNDITAVLGQAVESETESETVE